MNLIKYKDIILDGESGLTPGQISIFNEHIRGKYVYCMYWYWIMPLEKTANTQVSQWEYDLCNGIKTKTEVQSNILSQNIPHLFYNQIKDYIDLSSTETINDVSKYKIFNQYIPKDITLDEIKKFRTWLAETLLSFQPTDTKEIKILTYYKNKMSDDTVSSLEMFDLNKIILNKTVTNACNCGCTNTGSSIDIYNNCQPVEMYRKSVYYSMIDLFSNIEYWTARDEDFLIMFKRYVDGVIKANLDLTKPTYIDDFVECGCNLEIKTKQERSINRLKKLSEAIQMMKDNNISGNKNYIISALNEWATYLYEIMEW